MHERRPAFEAMQAYAQQAIDNGDLAGVNPHVLERMHSMFPVGRRWDGTIDVPADNDPFTSVPVLVLNEHEAIAYRPEQLRQNARTQLRQRYGITFGQGPVLDEDARMAWTGVVAESVLDIDAHTNNTTLARIPLLMVIENVSQYNAQFFANIQAHGADHWDFCRSGRALLQRSLRGTNDVYNILTERRAYGTSHTIHQNIGDYEALGMTPQELAASPFAGRPQEYALQIAATLARAAMQRHQPYAMSAIIARAITLKYADPETGAVTANEIAGYGAVRLVH